MNDVYFYEAFEEEAPALARFLPPGIRAGYSPRTIQADSAPTPPAPLVSIRTQSVVPPAWFPHLRGVLARTTGYDHLLALRERAGPALALACLDEYCSRAVAEQAALLWMALLRRLPRQLVQFPAFNRDGLTGGECAGRTLAVFGVGRIGHEICRIGRGLDMRVLGVDLVQRHPDLPLTDPARALAEADVIVCSMNLTAANRGYFGPGRLAGARRGALFVNIARGELAPAAGLLGALDQGLLGGIGLDVFSDEPRLADALRAGRLPDGDEFQAVAELRKRPQVILTPHNAFNTLEAVVRKSEWSAREIVHFREHGSFARPLPPAACC